MTFPSGIQKKRSDTAKENDSVGTTPRVPQRGERKREKIIYDNHAGGRIISPILSKGLLSIVGGLGSWGEGKKRVYSSEARLFFGGKEKTAHFELFSGERKRSQISAGHFE